MAVNIIVPVGGTGSRAADAFVYMAATGLLENPTGEMNTNMIYVVDQDANCGDTTDLKNTVAAYNNMRLASGLDIPEIQMDVWCTEACMNSLGGTSAYKNVAVSGRGHYDRYLVDMMHDEVEQELPLSKGFWGHPSLGAAIYGLMEQTDVFNGSQNNLFATIDGQFQAGQSVHVFLIGSLFGGTGASLMPSLARSLNERYGRNANFTLGGTMMLPYFTYGTGGGAAGAAESRVVKPRDYMAKTATALAHYHLEDTIDPDCKLIRVDNAVRGTAQHANAVFDSLYLIGLSPQEETCRVASGGGPDQKHRACISMMLAALSAVEFFNDKTAEVSEGTRHLFCAAREGGAISWADIPGPHETRYKMETMVRFCQAFFTCLYPVLSVPPQALGNNDMLYTLYHRHIPVNFDFEGSLTAVAPFCYRYLRFFNQIQSVPGGEGSGEQASAVTLFRALMLDRCVTQLTDPNTGSVREFAWFRQYGGWLMRASTNAADSANTNAWAEYECMMLEQVHTANRVSDPLKLQLAMRKRKALEQGFNGIQPLYRMAYQEISKR